LLLVHPECRLEVQDMADFVGSTSQIIEYVRKSSAKKFIIGTEMGILHQLKKDNPDKKLYLLSQGMVCPNMKKTTVESVYNSLKYMRYQIELRPDIIERARGALEAMLKV
jgi:quinolinate synthase